MQDNNSPSYKQEADPAWVERCFASMYMYIMRCTCTWICTCTCLARCLLEVTVAGGQRVDAVLSQVAAYLGAGGVRDDPLGLQNGAQEVDAAQVVVQGAGAAGPDDAVAHQLCIYGLQAALCLQACAAQA